MEAFAAISGKPKSTSYMHILSPTGHHQSSACPASERTWPSHLEILHSAESPERTQQTDHDRGCSAQLPEAGTVSTVPTHTQHGPQLAPGPPALSHAGTD